MRIDLVHPEFLHSNADALDAMVAEISISDGITRAEARLHLFEELEVQLVVEEVYGWFVACAFDAANLPWHHKWRQVERYLEDVVCESRQRVYHVAISEVTWIPDAISDIALPRLNDEYAAAYCNSPQVQAATEELAEMGLLALLLDDDAEVFMSDNDIVRYYETDPRATFDELREVWRDYTLPHTTNVFAAELEMRNELIDLEEELS